GWLVDGPQQETAQTPVGTGATASSLHVASEPSDAGSTNDPRSGSRDHHDDFPAVSRALASMIDLLKPIAGTDAVAIQGLGVSHLYLTRACQLLKELADGLSDRRLSQDDVARLLLLINHNLTEAVVLLSEERGRAKETFSRQSNTIVQELAVDAKAQLVQVGPRIMRLFHNAEEQVWLAPMS